MIQARAFFSLVPVGETFIRLLAVGGEGLNGTLNTTEWWNNDNNGGSSDAGGWDLLLPGGHQRGKHREQAGCREGEDGEKAFTTEEGAAPAVYGKFKFMFQLSWIVMRD